MSHARMTYALTPAPETYAAVELARQRLEDLNLSAETIAKLAAQRNHDLDEWDLSELQRTREKNLAEPVRALRRLETLILNALQEDDDA